MRYSQHKPGSAGITCVSRSPQRTTNPHRRFVWMLLCMLLAFSARADERDAGEPTCSTNIFDRCHTSLSRNVIETAVWFDTFFGDQRVEAESRRAYLRVRPSVKFSGADDSPKVRVGISAKAPLPNLEQRVQLVLDSIMDGEDFIEQPEHADGSVGDTDDDFYLSAAARLLFRDRPNSHLNLDLGLKLHSDDIEPFVKLRARSLSGGDIWALRFTQRLFWLESDGFGETSRLDLDWQPRNQTFFRATTEVTWSEVTEGVDVSQSLSLFRHLSDEGKVAGLILSGEGQTDPGRIDATAVAFRYRQPLRRKWVFVEIEPGVDFLHEDEYKPEPYLQIKLDIILGDYR